jgi:hypothetical protein
MHVIVPLAGPDFVRSDGSIKALSLCEGQPLLKYALDSRPWAPAVKRYTFILHDCERSRQFVHDCLTVWYHGCAIVYLSSFSRGAAMSALAGVSLNDDFFMPLIVDLADILYKSTVDILEILSTRATVNGIALVFRSSNPQYSFLATDRHGKCIEAAEKKVISDRASAGTYIFRDCACFIKAIAHAVENESSQTHNNLFYVCPLFNGVLAQGSQVALESVYDVLDLKLDGIHYG